MLLRLTGWIDEHPAPVRPHDDITVVAADILPCKSS